MKIHSSRIWWGFGLLTLLILSSSTLLGSSALLAQSTGSAQDDALAQEQDQYPYDLTVLFSGSLSEESAERGNYFLFHYPVKSGDIITITVLCEAADDGLRPIDPALTVNAPLVEGSPERWQWYNDDSPEISECVEYHSSQLQFEAPISGEYEIVVENLADRGGPFSLEISGSTAPQSTLILKPKFGATLAASGVTDAPGAMALVAGKPSSAFAQMTTTLTFKGALTGAGSSFDWQESHNILANNGDTISATLTCDEHNSVRGIDPYLRVTYTDTDEHLHQWSSVDETNGATHCYNSETNAVVSFTAPGDGVYTFSAENDGPAKGLYTLTINGVSATQPTATTPFWDGTSEHDHVWIVADFEGDRGIVVTDFLEGERVAALVTCEEDENGDRPFDPYLYVIGPDNVRIVSVDDSLDYQECDDWFSAYWEYTVTMGGMHSFHVPDLHNTETVPYRITILRELEDPPPPPPVEEEEEEDEEEEEETGPTPTPEPDNTRDCSGETLVGRLGEIGCIFSTTSPDGVGRRFDVYRVDENSRGHWVLSIFTSRLGNAPDSDEQIASGYNGMFWVIHQPDGSLIFYGGPNSEDKTFSVAFTGFTGTDPGNLEEAGQDRGPATRPTAIPYPYQTVHTVQAGDTLYSIATRYGVTVQAIADANGINPNDTIHPGNQLNIPNA